MQVKIEVSPEHTSPRAVIYTDRITPEIQRALDILQAKDAPVLADRGGRTFLLSGQDMDGEEAQRFQQLNLLLFADSRTSGFLMAEMRLQKMMAEIFGVLTQAAGMEIPLPV